MYKMDALSKYQQLIGISMSEHLKKASELSKQAENYESEGNWEYAKRCYAKILKLVKLAIIEAPNQEQKKLLQDKIKKYEELSQKADEKEAAKNRVTHTGKVSTFGFPQQKELVNLILPVKQQSNNYSNQYEPSNLKKDANLNVSKNNRISLQNIDPDIREFIVEKNNVTFNDIMGMDELKKVLNQTVKRPQIRPDLCSGIRAPSKGILLYGPPGNGKTLIGKALANESKMTFMSLSASSILNKFVGESEKKLKKIFDTAQKLSPTIIFIDQIDSILTERSQNQNEASKRLITQFLVLLDGITSPKAGQLLLIGATNLPDDLDMAAKRRFSKIIYVGMPEQETRQKILETKLSEVGYKLTKAQLKKVIAALDGYSASEITDLMKEVSMLPLRELTDSQFQKIKVEELRKVNYKDLMTVIKEKAPLLSEKDLARYKKM